MIEFVEKNNDAKRMIADLKNQVLEVKRDQNNLEQQLKREYKNLKGLNKTLCTLERNQMKNISNQFLKTTQGLQMKS